MQNKEKVTGAEIPEVLARAAESLSNAAESYARSLTAVADAIKAVANFSKETAIAGAISDIVQAEAKAPKAKTEKSTETKAPPVPEANDEDVDDVSLTMIRELITEKTSSGLTPQVIDLLKKHGAKNASTLAPENFKPFYNDLKELS